MEIKGIYLFFYFIKYIIVYKCEWVEDWGDGLVSIDLLSKF